MSIDSLPDVPFYLGKEGWKGIFGLAGIDISAPEPYQTAIIPPPSLGSDRGQRRRAAVVERSRKAFSIARTHIADDDVVGLRFGQGSQVVGSGKGG